MREAIGTRLREGRRDRSIKAKDLAATMGVSPEALSRMERGRQTIPAELLADWCRHLDVHLTFSAAGIEETPESLPPDHARLFNDLDPKHRKLVLEHLELVASLIGEGSPDPDKE
ncbi:helix-turn-helix domain-containing protein [Microbulbifer taiwanensis]|uniref:Helix-turn-helix domain-containing protein n=1 Tax=Microbulbifer taiwanensis TaxID=986746 RepID=A0ABW1YQ92_9GAMM|nr:helix-turn-helix transcriptional regulator [Microbulbifer taiwanensis]